ncbi:MAG: hypothetical protein HQK61_00405 [Desulfamplus sp.]|nr:hypothetical protein [Desulfamplus sp.]
MVRKMKSRVKNTPDIIQDPNHSELEWHLGPDQDINWYEASEWVKKLGLDEGGWRMPMLCELKDLYDKSVPSNCKIKPSSSSWLWVWSGEKRDHQYPDNRKTAWGFDFRHGLEFWGGCNESLRSRVFAVRLHKNKNDF